MRRSPKEADRAPIFGTSDRWPPSSGAGALIFFAGVQGGRRTEGVTGGLLVAVGTVVTCLTIMALWWTATLHPLAQAMRGRGLTSSGPAVARAS